MRTLLLLLLVAVAVVVAATPPRLVQLESRKPCQGRLACDGTFTRATFEATVQGREDVALLGHGLSLHGPFHTDHRLRGDIDPDRAHLCLDSDYCVASGQNVTVDVRASRVKTYYPLRAWLNQVPYEYFEYRQDLDLDALNFTSTALGLWPPNATAACAPRFLESAYSDAAFDFPCQLHADRFLASGQHVTPAMIEAQSGCDLSVADPIELGDFPGGNHRCTGVQCPPCVTGADPTGNATRLLTMHTAGPDCRVMGVRGAPVPFIELDVVVRNHDTGEEASIYTLVPLLGGTRDVYLYGDRRLRVYVDPSRVEPLNNVHGPDLEGDALVVCGGLGPPTSRRLENPFREAPANGRIPVPTRRYLDALRGPGHRVPFWYWLPSDEYAKYGRECGDVGVLEGVFRTSTALLEEVCYENRTCAPTTAPTPCDISAELNAYSLNTTIRAALLGVSGSDPTLIESARPTHLPPRAIWDALAPKTYIAALTGNHAHNAPSLFEALVVEGHRTEPPPVDLSVRVDVSDRLLPDAATSNVVYAQHLDPQLSQCTVDALHLTYCRLGRSLSGSDGATRPYRVTVECDPSMGNLTASIFANTQVTADNVATMTVDLPVGGAPGCFQIETPFLFTPTAVPPPAPTDPQWAGECRISLTDGTFQHVQVAPTQHMDCTRYPPAIRFLVQSADVVDKSHPNCTFFSTRDECRSYGITPLLVFVAFIIAVVAALVTTVVYMTQ